MSATGEALTQDHDFGIVTCPEDIKPENRERFAELDRRCEAMHETSIRSTKPSVSTDDVFAMIAGVHSRRQEQG